MSYIKREDVVGKKVITPEGNLYGTVRDLAFSLKGDIGLVLAAKDQTEVTIPIRQISAFGEYLLLASTPPPPAPPAPAPAPQPATKAKSQGGPRVCPSCGNPVSEGAKFCGKCGQKLA
jgi:sporulation protein YlmC with PRC-barrel domain